MKKEDKHQEELEKETDEEENEEQDNTDEEIEIEEFVQTPRISRNSPSLEKVNSETSEINLEKSLANVHIPTKESEETFRYSGKNEKEEEESKYQNYNSNRPIDYLSKVDLNEIGKSNSALERGVDFIKPPETFDRKSPETEYVSVERVDREKLGREEFEPKREVKYKLTV